MAATVVVGGPPATPAAADPPLTIAEAKAQIVELQTDASALDQEYAAVKEELDKGRKKLERKQDDVRAQTAKVRRIRLQVGQVALAQFQNRSLDPTAQLLLTDDSDAFLSRVSTVEKVNENQNDVLQDFQAEQAMLAELERSAGGDVAFLADQQRELRRLRDASDRKLDQAQTVLKRLSAEERARIAAEEAKRAAEARKEAQSEGSEGSDGSAATSTTSAAGSGRGAKAVSFAKSQLGKPYRFASAGPSAYDCSGLTFAAWKTAGVSLSRSSKTQFGDGRSVSRSELQPGDLVFFYSPISHVGLYAGNGSIIHSPRPGRSVEYAKVSSMPYTGARRPG